MLLKERKILLTCFCALFLLLLGKTASAASVTLAWTPSEDPRVAGYIVYYQGNNPADNSQHEQVVAGISSAQTTIWNLMSGVTYQIAAVAFDSLGDQSLPTAPIVYSVPGALPGFSPASVPSPSGPSAENSPLPPTIYYLPGTARLTIPDAVIAQSDSIQKPYTLKTVSNPSPGLRVGRVGSSVYVVSLPPVPPGASVASALSSFDTTFSQTFPHKKPVTTTGQVDLQPDAQALQCPNLVVQGVEGEAVVISLPAVLANCRSDNMDPVIQLQKLGKSANGASLSFNSTTLYEGVRGVIRYPARTGKKEAPEDSFEFYVKDQYGNVVSAQMTIQFHAPVVPGPAKSEKAVADVPRRELGAPRSLAERSPRQAAASSKTLRLSMPLISIRYEQPFMLILRASGANPGGNIDFISAKEKSSTNWTKLGSSQVGPDGTAEIQTSMSAPAASGYFSTREYPPAP